MSLVRVGIVILVVVVVLWVLNVTSMCVLLGTWVLLIWIVVGLMVSVVRTVCSSGRAVMLG